MKYWQAVIDKSPRNVPEWKLTNVSDEIWREGPADGELDNRRQDRVWKLNLSSLVARSLFVCRVSTMSIHLVFWFKLNSINWEGRIEEKASESARVWCHILNRRKDNKCQKRENNILWVDMGPLMLCWLMMECLSLHLENNFLDMNYLDSINMSIWSRTIKLY